MLHLRLPMATWPKLPLLLQFAAHEDFSVYPASLVRASTFTVLPRATGLHAWKGSLAPPAGRSFGAPVAQQCSLLVCCMRTAHLAPRSGAAACRAGCNALAHLPFRPLPQTGHDSEETFPPLSLTGHGACRRRRTTASCRRPGAWPSSSQPACTLTVRRPGAACAPSRQVQVLLPWNWSSHQLKPHWLSQRALCMCGQQACCMCPAWGPCMSPLPPQVVRVPDAASAPGWQLRAPPLWCCNSHRLKRQPAWALGLFKWWSGPASGEWAGEWALPSPDLACCSAACAPSSI